MTADDERIALFLDYENLAIGARESLGKALFDLRPIADALVAEAERFTGAHIVYANLDPGTLARVEAALAGVHPPAEVQQPRD